MDAKEQGNIGRFANHSCTPNLTNVFVYSDDWAIRFDPEVVDLDDFNGVKVQRIPMVCFFAKQRIEANTELTLHYGYQAGKLPGQCSTRDTIAPLFQNGATPRVEIYFAPAPERARCKTRLESKVKKCIPRFVSGCCFRPCAILPLR